MKIFYMFLMILIILFILTLCIYFLQKIMNSYSDKWSQFECGFMEMNPSHIPFSFQFFLIAILFLIFDIEIALILSFPMESINTKNIIMIFFFILILGMGLLYEWQKGKIDWSK